VKTNYQLNSIMTILCKHELVISHGTLITKILVIPLIIAIYEKGF
jgi:hypothetical protein